MVKVPRVYGSFGSLQEELLRQQVYDVLDAILAVLNGLEEGRR